MTRATASTSPAGGPPREPAARNRDARRLDSEPPFRSRPFLPFGALAALISCGLLTCLLELLFFALFLGKTGQNRGETEVCRRRTMAASKPIIIAGAARTPLGSFGGALSGLSCTELGSFAIEGALRRVRCTKASEDTVRASVEEAIVGNVLSAGLGQAPARQAALGARLKTETCCTTVNKVCSSGLKTVTYAVQSITLGDASCVVAGGMESMSRVPYYLPMNRGEAKYRMGDKQVWDGMIKDGLWDPYDNVHMGNCGEKCAKEFAITRQEQDDFSIESLRRALRSHREGKFKGEIEPVEVRAGRHTKVVAADEPLENLSEINEDKIR